MEVYQYVVTKNLGSIHPITTLQVSKVTSLDRSHHISYNVLGTQMRLEIYIGTLMNRYALGHALVYVRHHCERLIDIFRPDIQLPPERDLGSSWSIWGDIATGSTLGQHLKYSAVVDTMNGLYEVLYIQEMNREVEVEIFQDNVMVGAGNVTARSEISEKL